MIKRYFVRSSSLKPGMRIDQAIKDRMDRTLIARGTILNEYLIESLKKMGVTGIYVSEGEEDPEPAKPEPALPPQIQETIAQTRKADPAKVNLSESVKKQVSEGIQYLYNNPESQEFTNTASSITRNLMKAINENDAIAVDITALKTCDEYTFKHSVDVATMSMIIAKQKNLTQDAIYNIGIAGLLHDIGKSKIPLSILNKPAKLNDEEFAVMKQHPVLGYEILKEKNDIPQTVSFAVLQHHEKMNGKGYPMGVTGGQITPFAKIMSVVDVYDALVTERPYKKAFSQRIAVEMIMSMTEELDLDSMKSFLASVILYPVDTIVSLSNGEDAKVVKNNPHSILRPTVVGLTTGKVYNLADDLSCASVIIL